MMEALMVLVVVGVLAGIIQYPLRAWLQALRHGNNVSAVKHMLQTARTKALANPGRHFGVFFDVNARPQQVLVFADTYSPADYAYDPGKDRVHGEPRILERGDTLYLPQGQPGAIIFRGDGSAYLSGKIAVGRNGRKDTLDVLASTGRIRVIR